MTVEELYKIYLDDIFKKDTPSHIKVDTFYSKTFVQWCKDNGY